MSKKIIDGYHKDYHKNGEISKEGNLLNGKKSGTWKFYDNYGVLEKEENYLKGKKDGYFVHFKKNQKIKNGVHKDNKIYEYNKYIYDEESKRYDSPIRNERYREGKKHGLWKTHIEKKGHTPYTETINYRNGKKHGNSILEYSRESYSTNYKNGQKNGVYLRINKYDGRTLESGFYKDNKRHGEWTMFTLNGELQQRLLYKNGKKNGKCFFYHSYYGEDSHNMRTSHDFLDVYEYMNHEEIHILELIKFYVGNNRIIDTNLTIDFKDDQIHGLFIMNITNMNREEGKFCEINLRNGKRHGLYTLFNYHNFKKVYEHPYKNGMVHGTCYNYNNEYIKKETYKNNVKHGPYEESDKKPSSRRYIVEKGQYKNGKKEGIWKYYRDKVIKKGETWEKGKLIDSKKY